MCGIVGFLTSKNRGAAYASILSSMCGALAHRGPDDSGIFVDEAAGIGLGHRRLSIIDISETGHQPMMSACGRYVIVYNGEIYNFSDIRSELVGSGRATSFKGTSDTEVILAALSVWGIESALSRFNGMFAFALWDRERRTLTLARDRVGEKPLYYGMTGSTLLFGSELKALRKHPAWSFEIDRGSLPLFMRYSYIPTPYSIYRGVSKLPPGTYVTFDANDLKTESSAPLAYWRASDAVAQTRGEVPAGGAQNIAVLDELDALLRDAVRLRMVSDVPLGAFLSGGYDSTLIVALMQRQSSQKVKTFSLGFQALTHDEAPFARAVAKHLGTDHTEHYVSSEEALAVVPALAHIYDEPFADSSQIPTFLVSQLARKSVTVALTGDGGDEVFGGYNRYFRIARWWRSMERVPRPLRIAAAAGLGIVPARSIDAIGAALFGRRSGGAFADVIQKIASILPARTIDAAYRTLTSIVPAPEALLQEATEPLLAAGGTHAASIAPNPIERMMYLDLVSYLPDDILTKVDRASMAVSLEGRIPFLDHRVIEFAWRQPLDVKIDHGQGKLLLRNLVKRYVPANIMDRPKAGFGIPLNEWLRGPLRGWAGDLLSPAEIRREGYFQPDAVAKLWDEHRSGRRNRQHQLWNILMFRSWLAHNSAINGCTR